jgi:hypothetical protein
MRLILDRQAPGQYRNAELTGENMNTKDVIRFGQSLEDEVEELFLDGMKEGKEQINWVA